MTGERWSLLRGLPDDTRRQLLAGARRRTFRRRQVIFHEGDPGDSLHLIDKGHVAISTSTPLGDTALVSVLRPGDWFGELTLLSPGPRSATATAVEAAETLAIRRDAFDDVRRNHSAAHEVLVVALAQEVRRLSAALTEAQYLTAETRLWRRLLALADVFGGNQPVRVPLTQEELAQLAGAARQTVNRLLREAEAAGAVELGRGQCIVHDLTWIRRNAGMR